MKPRKKRVSVARVLPPLTQQPHERRNPDFLTDALADRRRFRVLATVETVSRMSRAIAANFSLTGERIVAMLDRLKETVGRPKFIAVDHGPQCISHALDTWAHRNHVQLEFSRPDTPTDNAYAESFNGHVRAECLDHHWFASPEEVRQTIEAWSVDDNTERPRWVLRYETRRLSRSPGSSRRSGPRAPGLTHYPHYLNQAGARSRSLRHRHLTLSAMTWRRRCTERFVYAPYVLTC